MGCIERNKRVGETGMNTEALTVGTSVVDRDGFEGVIAGVTLWNGSLWYDVRFDNGVAVRYPSDLKTRA